MSGQAKVDQDNVMDALVIAKETLDLLPHLPENIRPIHFHVLNAIYRIRDNSGHARVTDIARALRLLLPNVTKLINEMVNLNILEKSTSTFDKRVVLVRTTEIGERYMKDIQFFRQNLAEELGYISESNIICMIETINKVNRAIKKVCEEIKDKEAYPKS